MKDLIYIVEDDTNISEIIDCTLLSDGYQTLLFDNPDDFFISVKANPPKLILLDIMLPNLDGYEILKILKSDPDTYNIPVIFLTAKHTELDKVRGLDLGADDYISKPFGVLELSARVRSCIRRNFSQGVVKSCDRNLSTSSIYINFDTAEVIKNHEKINLTLKEFELLGIFMKNPNKILKREYLLSSIWGYNFVGESRTLDMHIKTLRTKLGDKAENPKYIKTIRGIGYIFIQNTN